MRKQVYKQEFLKKWRIYNIFYLSPLEQNTIRKKRVEDIQLDLKAPNSKEYKFKAI